MPMDRGSATGRSLMRTTLRKGLPRLRGGRESDVDRDIRKNEERTSLKEEEGRTLYPDGKRDLEP